MELNLRKDVPVEETWDLSLIYPTDEAMFADLQKAQDLCARIVKDYKGLLTTVSAINACLDDYRQLQQILYLTGTYTDLAVSVDYYNADNVQKNDKVSSVSTQIRSQLTFIDSELGEQEDSVLEEAASASTANAGYLMDVIRNKAHRLSQDTEKALAALSPVLRSPYEVYNMTKLADMRFPSFQANDTEHPLGYSLYEDDYEYEKDTEVRREAAKAFYGKLREYENTTATAYNTNVKCDKIMADLRGFDSVFDYLLFDQKVSRDMYDRQIDLIMEKLAPHMRRYAKLLQRIHKLDKMTYADLKIVVDPDYAPEVTIPQAREFAEKGLSILGEEYTQMVRDAFDQRWFDFAKNQGKSTGGFCASPYGKNSYILLSYNGRMSDVFTIAHELGHAGHFKSCNSAQSIFDTNVSSYFIEAPSTMNELIMTHYMLKTNNDKRFRRWVLSNIVSNTYYHNFVTHLLEAAYQREVYRIIDAGGSVQAETLNKLFRETLEKFWGDAVEITEGSELTWMRQPHYYMGLYSYTYSAGLTVATQACKRIEAEGQPAVDDWKKVLAAGSTGTPLELAQMAGVDISTSAPLEDTIATIGSYIDEICRLTDELEAE